MALCRRHDDTLNRMGLQPREAEIIHRFTAESVNTFVFCCGVKVEVKRITG